jgi:hypothetical protein
MYKVVAFLLLFLACVLGTAHPSFAGSSAQPMKSHPIEPTDWGFQCANGQPSCGTYGGWIKTTSQPGTTRLWNAGTNWPELETSQGAYDWTPLDTWLDMVAQHQPTAVIYTFGNVPCWIVSASCNGQPWSGNPPGDLGSGGSAAFTAFVTALVGHCSPSGNCVKDYIKYYEMWNEANETSFWSGTPGQLYNMFKPVIPIIRSHVKGAIISTPPICGGDATWMTSWLNLENANGRLSDYYGFHVYLRNYTPETRMSFITKMVNAKNAAGWTTTPWMNTETNFINTTFTCSTQYTPQDCKGQLVRWHVLQYAYQGGGGGAFHVGWFTWSSITAGGYDTYYYTMMQWLSGSTFTTSCSNSGTVWTCPLTEANGATALIVWNSAGNSSYKPAGQYVDYKEFNGTYGGANVQISSGEATTIGLIPIMFETVP